jgi:hypothetical protein
MAMRSEDLAGAERLVWDAFPHGERVDLRVGDPALDDPALVSWLAGLVPAAWASGLALVAAPGPRGDQVAGEGDLEGEVGGEFG